MSETNVSIACTLTPEEFRERKPEHLKKVGRWLLEVVERPDGYAFPRFPARRRAGRTV